MKSTLTEVIVGLVVYIVASQMITAVITGTSVGDTLIVTVVPIVLGAAVVMIPLGVKYFRGGA